MHLFWGEIEIGVHREREVEREERVPDYDEGQMTHSSSSLGCHSAFSFTNIQCKRRATKNRK
jgi:hypothetical protein